MVAANSLALEAQLEERPLAKKQEALLDDSAGTEDEKVAESAGEKGKEKLDEKPGQVKKALLKNDDAELQRVSGVGLPPIFVFRFRLNENICTDIGRSPCTVLQCL
jgi:RNA polymerase II subunit A C-terminal domain phosphatase